MNQEFDMYCVSEQLDTMSKVTLIVRSFEKYSIYHIRIYIYFISWLTLFRKLKKVIYVKCTIKKSRY